MSFPTLEILDPSSTSPPLFTTPAKLINDGQDVAHFLSSKAYRDICIFIMQLNRAVCPRREPPSLEPLSSPTNPTKGDSGDAVRTWVLPALSPTLLSLNPAHGNGDEDASLTTPPPPPRQRFSPSFASTNPTAPHLPAAIQRLRALLDTAAALIADAPPDSGPRRFGNVSFRTWHGLLEARASALLDDVLQLPTSTSANDSSSRDESSHRWAGIRAAAKPEIMAYLLGSWGNAQRLDYGTGHELSFIAFLGCLWKVGLFNDGTDDVNDNNSNNNDSGHIERAIVLGVVESYLAVVRRLIATYTLEPAGSHGVWGLDDHSFVPYIFGSAQLARAVRPRDPMPVDGSVDGAPMPGDIVKANVVARERGRNMYFAAVGFINDVKRGPFWEHSPLLFDISGVRDGWGKINKVRGYFFFSFSGLFCLFVCIFVTFHLYVSISTNRVIGHDQNVQR